MKHLKKILLPPRTYKGYIKRSKGMLGNEALASPETFEVKASLPKPYSQQHCR